MYRQSLDTHADRITAARIPVERIAGRVLLGAGGDDALWPSTLFAERIRARRAAAGLDTTVVTHPAAGHRVVLPGETPPAPRADLAHGGTPEADLELGAAVWHELVRALRA
ncbi:acyl-CoA thioester hydrolase/BAAT C-terminal domain-containing protein [Nocardioides sp.]|uniref:acyl-CoA thioester hydrolase/BAAT C-terminal domain-containing protein n=1 Tax=Nocardioides sp. TaxID=35761 RepID=UPI0039E5104C